VTVSIGEYLPAFRRHIIRKLKFWTFITLTSHDRQAAYKSVVSARFRVSLSVLRTRMFRARYSENVTRQELRLSFKFNQQDAALYNILYCCQYSTCFRRFFLPSSGAQTVHTASGMFQLTHASGSSKQA
jgi:hypothetical protein